MIEVQHLQKKYGAFTAVADLSFQVAAGQTLALLGTSGCGKTTTLKMINRLIEPTGGSIFIEGKNALQTAPEQLRRTIGYVIQDTGLFPHYTVAENIAVVPRLLNWSRKDIKARTHDLLERLGMPPAQVLHKFPHELSGGQQQRIGIARALAADPPIILMDEPFGALDPITRQSIRREFRELETLRSKTTIMVTHDVEEAFEMGDQICLLDKGKVQQLGTPAALLFQPANDFVAAFLADKRSNLQLQTLKIQDLFTQLPLIDEAIPAHAIKVSGEDSIQQTIDAFLALPFQKATAVCSVQGQQKQLTLNSLLSTFHQKISHA